MIVKLVFILFYFKSKYHYSNNFYFELVNFGIFSTFSIKYFMHKMYGIPKSNSEK